MIAGSVMDKVAVLNNDAGKTKFTYTAILPFLQLVYQELSEEAENNDLPIINEVDDLVVSVGMTDIGGATGPALPTDLIEIRSLWERLNGTTDDFIPMDRLNYLPTIQQKTDALVFWTWQNQIIQFLGATTDRQVRLNYLGNTLGTIVDETSPISMINAVTFLEFRTAALCSMYIGENETRATALQGDAQNALERLINPSVKGQQSIAIRRRPRRRFR